jgi:hypothetical protein
MQTGIHPNAPAAIKTQTNHQTSGNALSLTGDDKKSSLRYLKNLICKGSVKSGSVSARGPVFFLHT